MKKISVIGFLRPNAMNVRKIHKINRLTATRSWRESEREVDGNRVVFGENFVFVKKEISFDTKLLTFVTIRPKSIFVQRKRA